MYAFKPTMIYDLLKHMIKYKGDDHDASKNKNNKMNDINDYCWLERKGLVNPCLGIHVFQ